MRDYAMNRAAASESLGSALVTLYHNWQARRAMARLADCNDHLLKDIGVTRDDIDWVRHLPLSENPRLALEDRAFRRSLD